MASANFDFLKVHDAQLVWLGAQAERYFREDPKTWLIKLRQFAELLGPLKGATAELFAGPDEPQSDLLRRLKFERVIPGETSELFYQVRIIGNRANHALGGDHREALTTLKCARRDMIPIAPAEERKEIVRAI